MKNSSLFVAASVLTAVSSSAQITLTTDLIYNQNFDKAAFTADINKAGTDDPLFWDAGGDANSSDATQWQNNATFGGWYRQLFVGAVSDRQDKDFIGEMKGGTTRFGVATDFSSGFSGTYDTALGVVMQSTGTQSAFGVVFEVDAGLQVTSADISYTGEQWFRGANNDGGTLEFQYKVLNDISGFLINDETGWTDVNNLDFTALNTAAGAAKIDGNGAANSTDLSETVTLLADDTQFIAFRWKYDSVANNAQAGLFVDDFSVSFTTVSVPEVSSYALFFGVFSMGWIMIRRRY
ncbi:MAG: hypothetical protein AAF065_14055 [Verrucomicrobiota bacterium]